MGRHSEGEMPKTGDGEKGGAKPKTSDLAQRLPNGVKLIKQPSKGWGLGSLFIGRRKRR
jgi:hypothetical protein